MIDAKKIRPMNGYVLLQLSGGDKTPGGLFVPDQAKGKEQKRRPGTVVAVSEGEVTSEGRLVEPRVRVGDRVFLTSGASIEASSDFPGFAFVHQRDVLCVVTDAEN